MIFIYNNSYNIKMTTITDKITQQLETLNILDDPEVFGELVTLVRNDILGIS